MSDRERAYRIIYGALSGLFPYADPEDDVGLRNTAWWLVDALGIGQQPVLTWLPGRECSVRLQTHVRIGPTREGAA